MFDDTRIQLRQESLPKISLNESLPIAAYYENISNIIEHNQVTIIAGETGSGKTTQLPKICLKMGRGVQGYIGHTQPRRLAARSIAARIAEELNSPLGQYVGYKVRFHSQFNNSAYIKVMTDGILLNEIQEDRLLEQYDTLIIDEAHERSINIDFLLGYLKKILIKRPDLKLIITSATIDLERFSKHFNDAPIIQVSGRLFPVTIHYRSNYLLTQAIQELVDHGPGDILIFQSGEREIRESTKLIEKMDLNGIEVLPLYSRLSLQAQYKIFHQQQKRRIILATNIAETSITVPGIHYVIDTGFARISRYSSHTKVQGLPIEPISQASAKQRAGRCGRIKEGICIRLYDQTDLLSRPEYTQPEILRTNLASVILQLKSLNLGEMENFPFLQLPQRKYINDGYKLLFEIKAIDKHHELTPLGKIIAKWPLDPSLSAMLMAAKAFGCLSEVLIIVSFLSIQDPREKPLEKRQQATEKHRLFQDENSDFLTIIRLWQNFIEKKEQLSKRQLEKYCKEYYLAYQRMREWEDVYQQIEHLLNEHKLRFNQIAGDYAAIHKALLTGCLRYIALKADKKEYQGTRGINCLISPSSMLYKKMPQWIMAASFLETERTYAQTVAKIEPEWIEALAQHLIKRQYLEPHWEKNRSFVVAFEKSTLFGLVINPKKAINFGPIDSVLARDIFIREALLVENNLGKQSSRYLFLKHNIDLIKSIESLEHRARKRDMLVHQEIIFKFYDSRIPLNVYDEKTLHAWYSTLDTKNKSLLHLEKNDILTKSLDYDIEKQFPKFIDINGYHITLSYFFSPGEENDGVTAHIPLEVINQMPHYRWEWLVPGMLEEKITFLLKTLPKNIRKQCILLPNLVTTILDKIIPQEKKLTAVLSEVIYTYFKLKISEDCWDETKLPEHLKMHFAILNREGKRITTGQDLNELKRKLGSEIEKSIQKTTHFVENKDITQWNFGELPETLIEEVNGQKLIRYITLIDDVSSVHTGCVDNKGLAKWHMRQGLTRLLSISLKTELNYCIKNIPESTKLGLLFISIGSYQELLTDLQTSVLINVFLKEEDPWCVRNQEIFNQLIKDNKSKLISSFTTYAELIKVILERLSEVKNILKTNSNTPNKEDINFQITHLIYPGFIHNTPYKWLKRIPVYLSAIKQRIQKNNKAQDKNNILIIQQFWEAYKNACKPYFQMQHELPDSLIDLRFMVEELRISYFSQPIKTVEPISQKRLQLAFDDLKKNLKQG